MNYYLSKIIKFYSVAIFLAVLVSIQVLFPLENYAQEENQNAVINTELAANEDKQAETKDTMESETIVSEELPVEEKTVTAISETSDEAEKSEEINTATDDLTNSGESMQVDEGPAILGSDIKDEVDSEKPENIDSVNGEETDPENNQSDEMQEIDDVTETKEKISSPDVYVPGVIEVKKITIDENAQSIEPVSQSATKLKSVGVEKGSNGLAVTIESDGMIKDYKTFTLKRNASAKLPARIVFDILNLKSPFRKEQTVTVNTKWISKIRHYASPEKLRIVLDTKEEFFNDYSAKPISNGLLINIGDIEDEKAEKLISDLQKQNEEKPAEIKEEIISNVKAEIPDEIKEEMPAEVKEDMSDEIKIDELAETTTEVKLEQKELSVEKNDLKPAWVDRIDFKSEDNGKSTITIGTTKPVEYSMKKAGDKLLHLQLNNTNISTKQKRPLITTRFNSAVDGIWPVQMPEMKNKSIIAIELREDVQYSMDHSDNIINVHLEASKVLPKTEQDKNIPVWKEVLETVPKEVKEDIKAENTDEIKLVESKIVRSEEDDSEHEGKYTGEKIALDFYDTDIKNVFRILKEVSGKNFAIDKNVKGKVTLSLDKPVPWDQALDLVLKMNQLGMIYEGDIVRIAPLETIKKEKELRRAGLIAEKKAMEQQKALEPLVVEYIPVNYASAKKEILPHLKKIITKDRGNISVDERTNLIILTDVAEVIDQAKEIVRVLDQVTPQVVIEARIVEASTNFSKDIGVTWGSGIGVQTDSQLSSSLNSANTSTNANIVNSRVGYPKQQNGAGSLGGTYGVNTSINFPASASNAGSIGFNFVRVGGTPFMLNAKLQAMEADGEGKIVSSPKIATLDNKEATIKQGLRYPYNKLDTSGNTTTVFEDVDLELKVKPHVTPDNRISMEIKIKKRDLGNVINGQQSFTTKEAETELLINDGDTVVIGGIIKTTKSSGGSAIPGLSKIPILKWFFKSELKTDDKEELLIFITPKIVTLEQKAA